MITNHPRETAEATACRGRPHGDVAETVVIETVLRPLEEAATTYEIATRTHGDLAAAIALPTAPLTL
ncbi:hypothetical protein [Streptomyces sp. NPDC005281]|uniref:hypothetical protein n=1 Tax=Streptomyces sp. NPDC005281 TaxID=3155712 RepID=UPI0033B25BDC